MNKLLILIRICLLSCNESDKVYLCNGPQSKAYRKTNRCQGLQKSSMDIEATNIATAKVKYQRECEYCYR